MSCIVPAWVCKQIYASGACCVRLSSQAMQTGRHSGRLARCLYHVAETKRNTNSLQHHHKDSNMSKLLDAKKLKLMLRDPAIQGPGMLFSFVCLQGMYNTLQHVW